MLADEKAGRRLVRKIDWRLMPVMCFTYGLQYYDKAILSQAAIFGLREDLMIEDGLKYSWVSLIFYFGYLVGTYPISLLAQRYRIRVVCSVICVIWAMVILCTPACTSYAGLLVNRFFLGVVEAGVSPICMLVVGLWYTHSEQVLRSSLWYSCSGGSLLISPLINYGLGSITGGSLSPWQYMYLIAGAATFAWGIALWWLFPDSLEKTPGFSTEERQLLLERVKLNNSGLENKDFKLGQFKEAMSDYQFWAIMFANARLYIIAGACLPVILGCALLWKLPTSMQAGRILGFYLINFFSSAWVQCIGLGTSNVSGHTKKALYAAGTFVGYSLGNIVGPLMFDAKYAPRYDNGFIGLMVCFVVCFCVALLLRQALAAENRLRDREFGTQSDVGISDDLTDRENKNFRYNI
ncbi:major facilitator superfamily domain-containing protein [Aspergillus avenaceus]|uniref:Major facilitator superfamily domain-containing protein n=1 Tax=Aspergillus avenaceus TaxID=36643 RepID=A0A5N6TSL0_ASPAV|nr:major facilitator superfamily domain-containing protein [Aspergillus avenaceus]